MSSNINDIIRNIDKAKKQIRLKEKKGLIKIGEQGVGILKLNTPVKEGRLRNSMSYTTDGKSVDPLWADQPQDKLPVMKDDDIVVIGTNVVYGPRVEFIGKSAGYMLRSYNQLKKKVAKTMKSAFSAGGG